MASDRVLITGCGGMLGASVYPACTRKFEHVLATDIDLNEPWLERLDVREMAQCERVFQAFRPTLVLHLAALTDLEGCERDATNTWVTNALGAENVAVLSRRSDATMVYISTAGIFGGEQEEFNDFDQPNPRSIYAKSKYYGECFVERYVPKHFVFRPGWMMGGGPAKDKKFINKIYKQIKAGKRELFVVDDKLGTPTYTKDFAEASLKVIDTGYFGLYNQVCGGSCSRFDVAREFLAQLELTNEIRLTQVSSDYFKQEYFAHRPYSEKLVNLKLTSRNLNFMRDWRVCLAEYSRIFREDYYGPV